MKSLSSLNEYYYFIESILRTCPICRRSFVPKDIFCKSCWDKCIYENQNEEIRIIQNKFPSYAVFDWTEQTQKFIDPLIHITKGGKRSAVIKKTAESMIQFRSKFDLGEEQIVLVPAARSYDKQTDHALELAKSISHLTGFHVKDILRKSQKGEQKYKSNHERAKICIENIEKNTWFFDENTMYILVDDVVTTGSTALSSYIALNQPLYFEVWSLCYRPLLAPQE